MVNAEIRLIIFFAAKDGEALYSHQNQDQEQTVARIMNSLLPLGHSGPVLTLSNAARASLPSPRLLVADAGVCAASPLGELPLGT